MVVKYMHHGDDLVEHRTREASFGAQCSNHSANSMCTLADSKHDSSYYCNLAVDAHLFNSLQE